MCREGMEESSPCQGDEVLSECEAKGLFGLRRRDAPLEIRPACHKRSRKTESA